MALVRNEKLVTYNINEIENIKIHGRTDITQNPLPLFWNHSGVEVKVTGTELWIDLSVDCEFFEPWVAVEINGSLISRQMLLPGDYSICLFRSMLPEGVKTVKFYRELQSMADNTLCHVLVKGIRSDGRFLPVDEKRFKFEFVGDSITSGEGTYGASQDTEWISMYMSSSRHYANIIEKRLNADARLISLGGWGVYSGWDNDLRHNIPSIYEKISGPSTGEFYEKLGAQKKNDFKSWVPDAIIVNLGTNDQTAFVQPPFTNPETGEISKLKTNADGSFDKDDAAKISNAVFDFLKMLRNNNPTSHIVWAYGMLGGKINLTLIAGINKYIESTGDTNVAFLGLPDTACENFGSHAHPGFEAHIEVSKVLCKYLADYFGVEPGNCSVFH